MSRKPSKSKARATKRCKTRAQWANEIAALWKKSKGAVLETGQALLRAKSALEAGVFVEMIERDLPFSKSSARRFVKIASDPRLTDPANAQILPTASTALYELTKLSNDEFVRALDGGQINPRMTRNDVMKIRGSVWSLHTGEDSKLQATQVSQPTEASPQPEAADPQPTEAEKHASATAAAAHFLYHELLSEPGGDRSARAAMKLHTLLELDLAIDDITEDIFASMTRDERSRIERRIRHLVTRLDKLLTVLHRSRSEPLLAYEFDWPSN